MIGIQISHTAAVIAQFITARSPTLNEPVHTLQVIRVVVEGWWLLASDQPVTGTVMQPLTYVWVMSGCYC